MRLFGRRNNRTLEDELVELYSRLLLATGQMSPEECRNQVAAVVNGIKEECRREQIDYLAEDGGTRLFAAVARGISPYPERVASALREGATHADILAWWNIPYLSRRMMEFSETTMRYSSFLSHRERGMSEDEAMNAVREIFPMYGDPSDESDLQGDDRPLPPEIRLRVDVYREGEAGKDAIRRLRAAGFKTYNAFVRSEIRLGRL